MCQKERKKKVSQASNSVQGEKTWKPWRGRWSLDVLRRGYNVGYTTMVWILHGLFIQYSETPSVCSSSPHHMTLLLKKQETAISACNLSINTSPSLQSFPTTLLHTSLLFSPSVHPHRLNFFSSPKELSSTSYLNSPDGYKKIKQVSSNISSQTNCQKMLKFWKEKWLWVPRWPAWWCTERPFCGLCRREQKQIHYPNIMVGSSWVSKLTPKSWRGVWL